MLRYSILVLTIASYILHVESEGSLDSLLLLNGSSTTVNESAKIFSHKTTLSWDDHVGRVESEVLNFRNQTIDVNSTLNKIYEKEMKASKEIARLSNELHRIQIIAPILIVLRAFRPIIRKLFARIG